MTVTPLPNGDVQELTIVGSPLMLWHGPVLASTVLGGSGIIAANVTALLGKPGPTQLVEHQ